MANNNLVKVSTGASGFGITVFIKKAESVEPRVLLVQQKKFPKSQKWNGRTVSITSFVGIRAIEETTFSISFEDNKKKGKEAAHTQRKRAGAT
ncbi:N-acetylglucosaminyl-phosphatidylinositol biosynthetic protein [Corchorus olitorius]|uniref:N-acetylglucosaminyl-phosphatidylinositol biosynthetic protein n=1 Tax=Corchorus olitorius TaxID=93759 RepID=A0A1R3K9D2_9ROSI|nr:N-acetylglucosaminyl-phosphatidylinositol biosynthetic protein [Corchorus olitorius]